jgi:cysteinyl-tRNA synthetase
MAPAWEALGNDLNTPAALGALHGALRTGAGLDAAGARRTLPALAAFLYALGLRLFTRPAAAAATIAIPAAVEALAQARFAAKQQRDFATADRLRAELLELGWRVADSRDGYTLQPEPAGATLPPPALPT